MKVILICCFFFISFFSSTPSSDKIEWSASNKLNWSDFQGVPAKGAGFVASTSSGISFSYSFRFIEDVLNYDYTVKCNFYPKESWYKVEAASDYILKHEQTHFDISELHARILRKNISETDYTKNFKIEIEEVYKKVELLRQAMQNQFDLESNHSKNKEKEYYWEAFVAKQLEVYEHWK